MKFGLFFENTWNLYFKQRENFDQEYGNPAEGIREHDKKEAVGYSHILVQTTSQLCGINACLVDRVKHTGVGDDDDEEGYQVQSYAQHRTTENRIHAFTLDILLSCI